jgi:hypothetical protein
MEHRKAYGFKVILNDELICRAGFKKENSVVTCILDSVRRKNEDFEELNISIGGLNSETKENVNWFKKPLQEGDNISVEIITDNFDAPSIKRKPISKKDALERKLKLFYKLKEELKEHLIE